MVKTYSSYKNNTNFEPDYIWGREQEELIYPYLNHSFGGDLVHSQDRNSKFDMWNDRRNIEIKSRRCKRNTYRDAEITLDKCLELDGKSTYHIMNWQDEIGYIKYDANLYNTFRRVDKARNGDPNAVKTHIYIPVELFKTIYKGHRPDECKCLINLKDLGL